MKLTARTGPGMYPDSRLRTVTVKKFYVTGCKSVQIVQLALMAVIL